MALIERAALLGAIHQQYGSAMTIFTAKPLDFANMVEDAPAIDPIHAAGGCRCGECRFRGDPEECPILYFNQREIDEHDTSDTDFCSYGEPREAQDDG